MNHLLQVFVILMVLVYHLHSDLCNHKDYLLQLVLIHLHHWIDAMSFSDMSKNFDAEPGDIFYIQQNANQLVYAFREIARFWKNQILVDELDIIRKRIRYGVPEKYLELVEIKNVGRVRAKNLYHSGLIDRQTLRDISLDKLSAIDKIGITVAKSIKSQVERQDNWKKKSL